MKKHFGYLTQYYGYKDYPQTNNYDDAAWKKVIYRELSAGHPILYAGTSNKQGNDKTSSHAFVLDGYDADGNVGVNWGYGGLGDGYFDLSLLPLEYTDNGVSVDEEYQWYQEMVVIHCPDDGEIDYDLTSGLTPVVGVTKPCSSDVYDINGRKVSLPVKHDGIYIRGGKKYTVKQDSHQLQIISKSRQVCCCLSGFSCLFQEGLRKKSVYRQEKEFASNLGRFSLWYICKASSVTFFIAITKDI